jgi:LemA protein
MAALVFGGILFFAGLALVGWAVGAYNALVSLKNQMEQAWANIDVLLKQRRDELTKLIETVKGVKDFEQGTLMKVVEARSAALQAPAGSAGAAAAGAESSALRGLLVVAENYPQLKSDANFRQLQERISGLESQIADRREVFNESVNNYNTRIAQFPDSLFAGMLGYARHEYFRVEEAEKADVQVKF